MSEAFSLPTTKLNVGPGDFPMQGWLNLEPHDLVTLDKGQAKEIYMGHVIQYLTVKDADYYLHWCLNALMPGGRITVVTHDIRQASMLCLRGHIAPYQFWAEIMLGFKSYKDAQDHLEQNKTIPAKSCYDLDILFDKLTRAGFVGVRPIDTMTHPYLVSRFPSQIGMTAERPL